MQQLIQKITRGRIPADLGVLINQFVGPTHLLDAVKENYRAVIAAEHAAANAQIHFDAFKKKVFTPSAYAWHTVGAATYYCVYSEIWDADFVAHVRREQRERHYSWMNFTPQLADLRQNLMNQEIKLEIELNRSCCFWDSVTLYAYVGQGK